NQLNFRQTYNKKHYKLWCIRIFIYFCLKTDNTFMKPKKLRIGLIINDFKVSNWIFHIIQHISQFNNFEISLVIVLPNIERRKNLLFQNFIKYDSQRYPIKPDALKI